MSILTLEGFIRETVIVELGIMVKTRRLQYLSFAVMSSMIEFLGACLDNKGFHEPKRSRMRFEKAITDLDSFKKYRGFIGNRNRIDLYAELRSGLVHASLPKSKIELTERFDPMGKGTHLKERVLSNRTRNKKRLFLVCEDLYEDICNAANEVIQKMQADRTYHKASEPFLATKIEI
ncbi:MAG: hypothetical protein ACYDBP_06620 [Leptospirales bacterium]